jgi:ATP-dependent DNA helicase RecQ
MKINEIYAFTPGLLSANIKEDIHLLLKKYWGFDSFRPLQEEIILGVLSGRDTLALLPTGGGKSLCFQIPGLALGGSTLVVSPLVSLMNDQVDNLKKRGLSAVAITSAMNYKEIDIALNNAALGHVQFIYVSPERLQNESFRQRLSYLPFTLIAVDEAHCISQWGYDFRPSYLKVKDIREYFPSVNVIALTASATAEVVTDIQKQLSMRDPLVLRQSFARRNLRYVVQNEENKLPRLLKLISNIGGSGIVYVRNRRHTASIAAFLVENSITAASYHAGLKYDERREVQQKWIDNRIQVICATNAFGMGIDKPDVRFVVHLDLPESLEAYFQEAGRGGRDGKTAYSTIFFTASDQQRLRDNFNLSFPEPDYIRSCYQAICNYYQVAIGSGEGLSFEFDIDRICASYNLQPVLLFNSIRFLEKESYVSLVDTGYEPSKVMIEGTKEHLYEFQLRSPKFEPLIKALLRSYAGLFENYAAINEKELAYRLKTSAAIVTEQLETLGREQLISYIPRGSLPRIIFLQDRVNGKYVEFSPDHYHFLKEQQLARIESVIAYTDNNGVCRQVQLLRYFNEHDYTDCGHCDVCISKRPKDYESVKEKLTELLRVRELKLDDLRTGMRAYNDETWVSVFNQLIDDGIVSENAGNYRLAAD